MFGRVKFLFIYLVSLVFFFEATRLLFMAYHFSKAEQLLFGTAVSSLWYGARMDFSMAGYLLVPICLFVLASVFIAFFRNPIIYKVYSALILFLLLLITAADLEAYTAWGFRLDASVLKYLDSPKEAWASVSHLPVFRIIILFGLVFWGLCWLLFRWLTRATHLLQDVRNKVWSVLLVLAFSACLVIPIRGGFQLTPMNQSAVYFSKNLFANQAAINAPWNLLYGLMDKTSATRNPYLYLPSATAIQIVDSLYAERTTTSKQVLTSSTPNIIFIIWESFTAKATRLAIDGKEVTPSFNSFKKEGIYFSNLYASGDRTDRGLSAILSGYPALPQTSIVRFPNKAAKISSLSRLYKAKGYKTSFYYGGETEFANIKSYLVQGGYDPIVDIHSFSKKDQNSKWGAHDGVVADRVLADLRKTAQPFFATWLTLTSHEPFETPVPVVFKGSDDTNKFLNSLHYTDAVLHDFIEKSKQQPWWKNTVIVIVGDHGHRLPATDNEFERFLTPMLWLGGAVKEKRLVVDKITSQLDIAASLAGQTSLDEKNFPFSKNSLAADYKPWAFFSFNNGFGYVQPSGSFIFDNVGRTIVVQKGTITPSVLDAGKALQQQTFQDFFDK
jgi:phosphoglycerol transferase MdoB-like AlkP superfamily enzyme